MPSKVPVLLLGFNRPWLSRQVFEQIRVYQPGELYFAVDGPRDGRPGESEQVNEVCKLVAAVDWPCRVQTLFHASNLGCQDAVTAGINWFFRHVEEGIILEDDCLPTQDFFQFCQELLVKYRSDTRIMSICGEAYGDHASDAGNSYSFSRYALVWGWASWRRAWDMYDPRMTGYEVDFKTGWLAEYCGGSENSEYWKYLLDCTASRAANTWDYQWLFTHWVNNGLCVHPRANLITNLGCGPEATHTTSSDYDLANRPLAPLNFPLRHPATVKQDFVLDRALEILRFAIPSGWWRHGQEAKLTPPKRSLFYRLAKKGWHAVKSAGPLIKRHSSPGSLPTGNNRSGQQLSDSSIK